MVVGLLTCSRARRWQQENRAVGHHAVHVEQHHLDLLCALRGHSAILAAATNRALALSSLERHQQILAVAKNFFGAMDAELTALRVRVTRLEKKLGMAA
jgi:hypothetical protein